MSYPVATLEQARVGLEYFNGFHDGFIRRLGLVSHDRFEARGVHTLSGRLDLELDLAHYNYREGRRPTRSSSCASRKCATSGSICPTPTASGPS